MLFNRYSLRMYYDVMLYYLPQARKCRAGKRGLGTGHRGMQALL